MAANHPQLGAALSNIAELNRVYLEHQRESLREAEAGSRGSEKSAKNPKKRDDREKKPKKRKDKKRKDDRKSKKRKRERDDTKSKRGKKSKSRSRKEREASSSSSSSSSSSRSSGESSGGSDDDGVVGCASDSNAVDTAKRILAGFPDVRTDLANILRSVDAGEAVSVAGVPDDRLRAEMTALFRALGMRARETAKTGRLWSSRKGAEAVLARGAPAFEGVGGEQTLETLSETRGKEKDAAPDPEVARAEEAKNLAPIVAPNEANEAVVREAALARRAEAKNENDDARTTKPPVTNPTELHEREPVTHIEPPAIGPSIGPAMPPPSRPPPRVVLGPAMPPRAALEAAAALAADGDVGPAPPEIVREVELVGAEARAAAAARVLAAVRGSGDAYDILGVDPGVASGAGVDARAVTPAALKKVFWKLSLSVHPDKCAHPDAAGAFDAVKKAHEQLCDPAARSRVDAAREERAARAGFDSWLEQERARARWRATRGEAAPGDEAILRGGEGPEETRGGREEWMTKLPEQRRPVAGGEPASGGSGAAKAFARTTFVERDARTVADWTAAPSEAAEAEKRLLLAAREAMYAAPAEAAEAAEARRRLEQVARASRGQTLLEKHQEREARAAKAAKAKKKEAKKKGDAARAGDGDGTGWTYKPWNRETDLEAGRASTKALSAGELLKKAGGDLKGRFGSGGGGTEGGGR